MKSNLRPNGIKAEKQLSYLVTGGLGLVGSALANTLEGKIRIISRSDRNRDRLNKKDIRVSLKTLSELEKSDVEGINVIYHCASTVHNYHVLDDPYLDIDTNLNGTIRLLELCRGLAEKPKIVFLSTFFVYGNEYERTKIPINEASRTDPLALYPATKLCAESIIKLYSRLYSIPYLICRLTNIYGEHESYDSIKKGALNFLVMKAVKGEDINLYKGGDMYRDYIHVDDVVSALRFLEERVSNDLFLIGFGQPVKFRDLIDYVLEKTGQRSKIISVEPPLFHKVVGITNFVADTSKINSLGWQAQVDYKAGLDRVLRHCRFKARGV